MRTSPYSFRKEPSRDSVLRCIPITLKQTLNLWPDQEANLTYEQLEDPSQNPQTPLWTKIRLFALRKA